MSAIKRARGSTRRAGTALALALTFALGGCAPGEVPQSGREKVTPKQPDAHELMTTTLGWINDTIEASEGGTGWHLGAGAGEDDIPWVWPMSTDGYAPGPCSPESFTADHGWQYGIVVSDQTPLADPFVHLRNVRAAWEAKGWEVYTIVERRSGDNPGAEIAVEFANGAGVGYSAFSRGAQVDASSECSTHPSTEGLTE